MDIKELSLVLYSRIEDSFLKFITEQEKYIRENLGFNKSHPLYFVSLNLQVETFSLETKKMYWEMKELYINEFGIFMNTTLSFYEVINKVIDNSYKEFNKDWPSQKKFSRYKDPDMELLAF